jgi:hypothetical protein
MCQLVLLHFTCYKTVLQYVNIILEEKCLKLQYIMYILSEESVTQEDFTVWKDNADFETWNEF